ncbi:DUF2851 family protein [Pedobacter glucosidilyticus]|uniref:DUF2851 family protein n=1 Tax=Pedobacter glucosidilyticus TaxID=1122941 RepID=UPI000420A1B8|nr:DUF2851 family protein [Pedobacter glucosidilyticus]
MLHYEKILHYIWRFRLFNFHDLRTVKGEQVEIIHPGNINVDAGPDFYDAKIKIGNTLWAGTVEIHLSSSDWLKHQHQHDKAYDNVVLHVVWDDDTAIQRSDGTYIPTLVLKHRVEEATIQKIEGLACSNESIPCAEQLKLVDEFYIKQWLDRMVVERLEEKSAYFEALHKQLKGSWEDTFYIGLARSFGFKVNSLPFELLAKNLPQQILAKHKQNSLQIEALIFGMSGLLHERYRDEYPKKLKAEFDFLRQKYQLNPLEPSVWKFSKTRPDNFPTIRLAQFAALINQSQHLFSKVTATSDVKALKVLFSDLNVHPYWANHYLFDEEAVKASRNIGDASVNHILINTIAPLLFNYGKQISNPKFVDYATTLLENVKAEKNVIIDNFTNIGLKIDSASESQAVIQLKKYYCDEKKCLNCGIGIKILKV